MGVQVGAVEKEVEGLDDATGVTSATDPIPPTAQSQTSVLEIAASLKRIKIWLIVLTVLFIVMLLVSCGAIAVSMFNYIGMPMGAMTVSDSQLDSVRQDFEDGYGDAIESLDVRRVKMEYGGVPFPYSLIESDSEEYAYVECKLNTPDILIADMVGISWGMDPASSGMIPTKGSLRSRMTEEQLNRLLTAYAAETRSPLGTVFRYGDSPDMMYGDTGLSETITVNGQQYSMDELWSVTEGMVVEGDTVDMNDGSAFMRNAFIFYEDPETGEFTYLGTEQGSTMY